MARKKTRPVTVNNGSDLLAKLNPRRVRPLILPRLLEAAAGNMNYRGPKQDQAWALDASFLLEIFGDALGYKTATQSPAKYHLERNFTVPGIGTADGALGEFSRGTYPAPSPSSN
jgi:hypothetical protein